MKNHESEQIKKKLAKNHACYVLITCDAPKKDGDMDVEMSYQGPVELASYLLEGAQTYLDQKVEEEAEADAEAGVERI